MAFGRKVNHSVHFVFFEDIHNRLEVADIGLHEGVIWFVFDVLQVGKVARVSQLVYVNDMIIRIFVHEKSHYVTSNESCTAGDDDVFHILLTQIFNESFQYGIVIFNSFLIFVLSSTE